MMIIPNTLYFSRIDTLSDTRNEETGEACIANISPLERQKRMRFGIVQFAISLVILAVLVILNVNPLWRFPLLLMFTAAATGYFQAKDKT